MKEKLNQLISECEEALNEITETDSDSQATKAWINDNFIKQVKEVVNGEPGK